jgi:hypothetical protein
MATMNAAVKAKWLEALRSGEYEQGMGALKKDGKYCCLGVLCDVLIKDAELSQQFTVREEEELDGGRICFSYMGNRASDVIPLALGRALDINDTNPVVEVTEALAAQIGFGYHTTSLAQLNDAGYSFLKIADVIDATL